jgi:hypothetical protein
MAARETLNGAYLSWTRTVLYKEFLAERQEILCHKWIENEKAGHDIGFEHALSDWTLKYRSAWLEKRLQQMAGHESPRTTKLYDRTKDEITLSEVERIRL